MIKVKCVIKILEFFSKYKMYVLDCVWFHFPNLDRRHKVNYSIKLSSGFTKKMKIIIKGANG